MNIEITTDGRIVLTSSPQKGMAVLTLAEDNCINIVDDGSKLLAYPTPDAILKPTNPRFAHETAEPTTGE